MTVTRNSFLAVLLMAVIVAMTTGCACKAPGKGAHAFAQKGDTTMPVEPEDDFGERPTGVMPITDWPGAAAAGVCQRIHFDYDKSNIKPEWVDCLNKIAAFMTQNPELVLIIEGHCDERGSNEYNMALGERRANSTAEYLVQRGLNANRIQTRSMGEEEPLAGCSNESCWWQNRRGEFFVYAQGR